MAQAGNAFYTGLFRHTLDDKGRLTVPSAWRAAHAETDTFLATPHPDGYIAVLPPSEVVKLHEKISAMKLSAAEDEATEKEPEEAPEPEKAEDEGALPAPEKSEA